MTRAAKHLFALTVAIVITAASFSETVAVPSQQTRSAPAGLAA